MEVRQKIMEKVNSMKLFQPEPVIHMPNTRSRKGIKHSTTKCNAEGFLEKELKLREFEDTPAGNKYKSKHRSHMKSEDIDKMVQEYKTKNIT